MEVCGDEFMGLSVEMDGEPCGELKNSVEQWRWYQLNYTYRYVQGWSQLIWSGQAKGQDWIATP